MIGWRGVYLGAAEGDSGGFVWAKAEEGWGFHLESTVNGAVCKGEFREVDRN